MNPRPQNHLVAVLAVTSLLSLASTGCTRTEKNVDEEPFGSAMPTATAAATAAPSVVPTVPVQSPTPTAPRPVPVTTPDGGVRLDAGTPAADAGTPAVADAGAGGSAAKLKSCVDKCQAALAGCLTPVFSKDGGLPQAPNPVTCQGAFTSCQSACAP